MKEKSGLNRREEKKEGRFQRMLDQERTVVQHFGKKKKAFRIKPDKKWKK